MRIAVAIVTSGQVSGGAHKYLRQLMPLLASVRKNDDIFLFVPDTIKDLTISGVSLQMWSTNGLLGHSTLRENIQSIKPDVVFFPTARWFNCGDVPTVVMVRNMEPLVRPISGYRFSEAIRNIARYIVALRSCRNATRVIAVSNFVKDYLIHRWNISEDKIGVVYHGIENNVVNQSSAPLDYTMNVADEVSVLTAGSIRPARGLEDLVKALSILKDKGIKPKLYIAGKVDRGMGGYKKKIDRLASDLGVNSQLIWLGHISESEIAWFYSNTSIFTMTSRIEACPNIAIEAMSHGCICISSDNPPLPEFFGDSALFYKAEDGDSLATQISAVHHMNEETRNIYRDRARSRAQRFDWSDTALRTISQLESAIETYNI